MATTTFAPSLSSDVTRYLADDLLPLTLTELVMYDFSEKLVLPKGHGTTYTMSRYARIPLAFAPTAEGVPPIATPLTVSQATVSLSQWTALVTITDVTQLLRHGNWSADYRRLRIAGRKLLRTESPGGA